MNKHSDGHPWDQEVMQTLIKKFSKDFRDNYLDLSFDATQVSAEDFEKKHVKGIITKSDINSLVKQDANHIDKAKITKKEKIALKKQKLTAGPKWFDMKAPILTPELSNEVKLIKLQHVLDQNYKYRKEDEIIPKHFEIGTMVDTHDDYYNRNTRKERNTSMADIMMQKSKEMRGKPLKGINKTAMHRRAILRSIAKKKQAKRAKSQSSE